MAAVTFHTSNPSIFRMGELEEAVLSLDTLTMRELYELRKERIRETFQDAHFGLKLIEESERPSEDIWDVLAIAPEVDSSSFKAAMTLVAPVALDATLTVVGRGEKEEESSSGLPFLVWGVIGVVGVTIAGAGVYHYTVNYSTYTSFEEELKLEIQGLYENLKNLEISRDDLSRQVTEISHKRGGSVFPRIFDYKNPNEMYKFLIASGIAQDSQDQNSEAQKIYENALKAHPTIYQTNKHQLHHLLSYLCARSLRLSGRSNEASRYINEIPEDSEIRPLGNIESQAIINLDEAFDEEDLPFILRCPITLQIMRDPVYHEQNGHRHYYERAAIQTWLQRNAIDPFLRTPLRPEDLRPDPKLARAIKYWNLTQLRRNP